MNLSFSQQDPHFIYGKELLSLKEIFIYLLY